MQVFGLVRNKFFHNQKQSSMKIHLLIMALAACSMATAQGPSDLYGQKYRRWGLVLGTGFYQAENSTDNLYAWDAAQSFNAGLVYNLWQQRGFNLRAGAVLNTWKKTEDIQKFNANGMRTYWYNTAVRMNLMRLPVELEYYLPINKQVYLVPMVGIDGQFFLFGPPSSSGISNVNVGSIQANNSVQEQAPRSFNTAGRIGMSVAFATQPALFSLGVHYGRQFSGNLFEGSYSETLNGVQKNGWQRYTGNWWGIGLTIVPKKK
jgi:hypothetical protein